jgi:hypothetical protein
MLAVVWALPFLIALEVLPADTNAWVKYAVVTLLIGYPYCKYFRSWIVELQASLIIFL